MLKFVILNALMSEISDCGQLIQFTIFLYSCIESIAFICDFKIGILALILSSSGSVILKQLTMETSGELGADLIRQVMLSLISIFTVIALAVVVSHIVDLHKRLRLLFDES